MSCQVAGVSQGTGRDPYIELAEVLHGKASLPEDILKTAFNSIIDSLGKTTLDSERRKRVWESTSKDKLPIIRQAYLQAMGNEVYRQLSEKDVRALLQQYKSHGFACSGCSQQLYTSKIARVIEKATQAVEPIVPNWTLEITREIDANS